MLNFHGETEPPNIGAELKYLYKLLLLKVVTRSNIKACRHLLKYSAELLNVQEECRTKWPKDIQKLYKECARQKLRVKEQVKELKAMKKIQPLDEPMTSQKEESKPTEEDLRLPRSMLEMSQNITEENVEVGEHWAKFKKDMMTIAPEVRTTMVDSKRQLLTECARKVVELERSIDELRSKSIPQPFPDRHERQNKESANYRESICEVRWMMLKPEQAKVLLERLDEAAKAPKSHIIFKDEAIDLCIARSKLGNISVSNRITTTPELFDFTEGNVQIKLCNVPLVKENLPDVLKEYEKHKADGIRKMELAKARVKHEARDNQSMEGLLSTKKRRVMINQEPK